MKAKMKATTRTEPTMELSALATEYKKRDRDPLMLRCVMLMESSGLTNTHISVRCGVAWGTLQNWKNGKTRRPQASSLRFVLRAIGYELTIKKS